MRRFLYRNAQDQNVVQECSAYGIWINVALQQDQNVGTVLLNIKIDGSVKWK
ncbi:hypothetical protein FCV25MIE_08739, partial [Fagus crenata]